MSIKSLSWNEWIPSWLRHVSHCLSAIALLAFVTSPAVHAQETVAASVELEPGWSLVSIPVAPKEPYLCSDFTSEAAIQGVAISAIAGMERNQWSVFLPGMPFNDLPIVPEEAIMVYSTGGSISLSGPNPFPCPETPTPTPVLTATPTPTFTPDAIRLGLSNFPYIDPEIDSETNQLVYQDGQSNFWLAGLDPQTGEFTGDGSGRETLIDTGLTPLLVSNNGPEFGRDRFGWAMFYSKGTSPPRLWRADLNGTSFITSPVTAADAPRANCIVSRNDNADSVYLAYLRGSALQGGPLFWISEDTPQQESFIDTWDRSMSTPLQWLPDRDGMVVVRALPGESNKRLGVLNTANGQVSFFTDDSADYRDPAPFNAPEWNGDLGVAAVEDLNTLVVWREMADGSWRQQSRLSIPDSSQYAVMQSPEAFIFRGRTFVSLQIESPVGGTLEPAEIWVFGINDGPDRIALRVDDGSDLPVRRTDPEFYVTPYDAFVFYNVFNDNGQYEIWRGRTHLGALLP